MIPAQSCHIVVPKRNCDADLGFSELYTQRALCERGMRSFLRLCPWINQNFQTTINTTFSGPKLRAAREQPLASVLFEGTCHWRFFSEDIHLSLVII